jgi:hypothetical protein
LTGQSGDPGGDQRSGGIADSIAGIQANVERWLIRSGAENMRREVGDQFRRAFGGGRADAGEVWNTATTETPPTETAGEAPECAWCPVCRAARRMRETGTPLGGLSGAGDAVAAAVQEALSAFDSFLSMRTSPPRTQPPRTQRPDHEPDGRG